MNYLAELRGLLEKKRQEAQEQIVGGNVSDFAEYRRMVGVCEGLEHALVEIAEMIQRIAKSEEEA